MNPKRLAHNLILTSGLLAVAACASNSDLEALRSDVRAAQASAEASQKASERAAEDARRASQKAEAIFQQSLRK